MQHRRRHLENTNISSSFSSVLKIQGIGGGLVLVYAKIIMQNISSTSFGELFVQIFFVSHYKSQNVFLEIVN